jgi:peptidoglycan hydrolase-like protein with peptidoglycan-binding domain
MPDSTIPSTLTTGSAGEDVELLQRFLVALSFAPGDVEPDGTFSDTTSEQVAAFKNSQGLPDDGTVDADTWMALFAAIGPTPSADMPVVNLQDYPALSQLLAYAANSDVDGYVSAENIG